MVLARHPAELGAAGRLALPSPALAAVQAVAEIARHWDAAAVTAFEYVETAAGAVLERLLRAAPALGGRLLGAPERLAA